MLEVGASLQALGARAGQVVCEVWLPPDWNAAPASGQPLSTVADDRRRFPRFHYRVRGLYEPAATFPALARPEKVFVVYTKDISRGGIAFLHSEELFPKEHGRLRLPRKFDREFEVVRCLRFAERCYLVGARFPEPMEAEELAVLVG